MKLFHKWFYFLRPAKIRLPLAIVFAFLIFLPLISSGKIFWGRFPTQGRSIFDTTGTWRRIYKAPLTINGARATLSIHGCDEPLELVKARLKQNFGLASEASRGKPRGIFAKPCDLSSEAIRAKGEAKDVIPPCGNLPAVLRTALQAGPQGFLAKEGEENSFWMFSAASNQVARLLALAMPNSDKSLIFTIDQSPAEFSESTAVPQGSVFPGYSLLPGSRAETIIKNEETGAMLETRIADAAPDIVIGEISAKLSRHGWKQIYPASGDSPSQSAMAERGASPADNDGDSKQCFMIFQREEALATIMAGPALRENKSCVTILFKEKTGQ